MSDVTLLRKLSYKSLMKFGKFQDYTVQQILDLNGGHGIKYLIWCYFKSSKITFLDDILDALCIPDHVRITKPGKVSDEELEHCFSECKKLRSEIFKQFDEDEQRRILGNNRKEAIFYRKSKKMKNEILDISYKNKTLNRERNQKH